MLLLIMLVLIGVWSACLFIAGLTFAGAFASDAGSFYWFTLPFLADTAVCVVLCCAGVVIRRTRQTVFWVVAPFHALLFVPFLFAMALWPGGDDGPGLAWLFLIGGGSLIAFFLSGTLMTIVCVLKKRRAWHAMPLHQRKSA
jgi:hypothetical protein